MGEIKGTFRCAICGKPIIDQEGHDPAPVSEKGLCCESCYWEKVLPERIAAAAGV